MDTDDGRAARFDQQRARLTGLARRLLGSSEDAEDAVQEAWIRLQRQLEPIENLDGWLTTVVSRISLNVLRSRRLPGPVATGMPDPVVTAVEGGPEEQALLAESVSLALLVVLDTLSPSERVAFVLHDVFEVPFHDIAPLLGSTADAVRQRASRARKRLREAPRPADDAAGQRRVVEAFFAAGRAGRLAELVAVLHEDVVLRADDGRGPTRTEGADAVARRARSFAGPDREVRPAVVNGAAGAVIVVAGRPVAVMAFGVAAGRIVSIDALIDPDRIARLDLTWLIHRPG